MIDKAVLDYGNVILGSFSFLMFPLPAVVNVQGVCASSSNNFDGKTPTFNLRKLYMEEIINLNIRFIFYF